ncbi:MAG: nitrite reductase (NAD(P)H) small subunit, partial [Chloroflexota bacterium]|nr:nitrite reductase (NAD(P)H) small subunit [Chloroflexota bacterium]
ACVTCPWHGSEFDLRDGTVIHGPATTPLHAYETRVEGGSVQIRSLPG